MTDAVDADTAPLRRSSRFACVVAALTAGALIAAVPHRARAQDSAAADQCSAAFQNAHQAPFGVTNILLRVLPPSIEPVPATDGLIHLAYMAQVTNVDKASRPPADIVKAVAVDPTAKFTPTGLNISLDQNGQDVAGKIMQYGSDPFAPTFFTSLPSASGGLMLFDVTYAYQAGVLLQAQVPPLLAHAITYTQSALLPPPGYTELTDPVPVGCVPLAVIHPPLVGHGWFAESGCCLYSLYHRTVVNPMGGELWTTEQFAIDWIQLGPNGSVLNGTGPLQVPTSWWGYGTPVLAVASGVVVEKVDGIPDTLPVESNPNIQDETASGNHVIEDIGHGRYAEYEHLKLGSVAVTVGQKVKVGQPLGNVGTSGNSFNPHLHFQVIDRPDDFKAHGLPFVFDTQLLQGRVRPEFTNGIVSKVEAGDVVPIDTTGHGVKRNLMPERNGVFGFNLPPASPED